MSGPPMAVATKLPPYAQLAQARVQQNQNVDTEARIKRLEATSNEAAIALTEGSLVFFVLFDYMDRSLKGPLRHSSGLDQRIALAFPALGEIATVAGTSLVAGVLSASEFLKASAPLVSRIRVPEFVDCATITAVALAAAVFSMNGNVDFVNLIGVTALCLSCIKDLTAGKSLTAKITALAFFSMYSGFLSTRP